MEALAALAATVAEAAAAAAAMAAVGMATAAAAAAEDAAAAADAAVGSKQESEESADHPGGVQRSGDNKRHRLEVKSSKRSRKLQADSAVSSADTKNVKRLLGMR